MPIGFAVAAKASETPQDEDVVEVPIDDVIYFARRPTTAMGALLTDALQSGQLGTVYKLIEGLLGEDARKHVERLVWARRVDFDDLIGGSEQNPEGGLIDQIFAEFAGHPTEPSTASSASPRTGGRRSQGRSPGKGSTRSTSPSTDS